MTKEWSTDAMNARIIKMARKYSLDAGKLKDVMISRCRGMNNCEISECCGLNRNTANKYVSVLGDMEEKEIYEILYLLGKTGLGMK